MSSFMKLAAWAAVALAAQTALGMAIAADRYTALEIAPPGGTACRTAGINASGQMVGAIYTDSTLQIGRGFVTGPNGAGVRVIDTLGGDRSILLAINDDGTAVGAATTVNNATQSSVMVPAGYSTPFDLGGLGGIGSSASDISKKGQVVGSGQLPDLSFGGYLTVKDAPQTKIFLGLNLFPMGVTDDGTAVGLAMTPQWTGSTPFMTGPNGKGLTMLSALGGSWAYATALNKRKEVIGMGMTVNDSGIHGFVTDQYGANPRDLGVPGMVVTPMKINASGLIVGHTFTGAGTVPQYAFLATRYGKYWDLNSLVTLGQGRILQQATSINDKGQIAATTADNKCYLLTPVER